MKKKTDLPALVARIEAIAIECKELAPSEERLVTLENRLKAETGVIVCDLRNIFDRLTRLENHAQVPEDVSGRFVRLEGRLDRFENDLRRVSRVTDSPAQAEEKLPDHVVWPSAAVLAGPIKSDCSGNFVSPTRPNLSPIRCIRCSAHLGINTTPGITPKLTCQACHTHLMARLLPHD